MKKFTTEIKETEKSTAQILVTISEEQFAKYKDSALTKLRTVAEVDGFRKGHAPDELILKKYGEMALFEEMANLAIDETFADAVIESKLDIIGRPEISITKLAPKNEFAYAIFTSLMPKLILPDYLKISKEVKSEEEDVKESDIDEVLNELRRMRAHKDLHSENEHTDDSLHDDEHKKVDSKTAEELPELDDEYIKTLGDFKNLEELKSKIKENLKLEKKQKSLEKRRNEILEKIEKDTKGEIPEVLIESESERMIAEMRGNVAQMGGKFEEYLSYIKKTESDLKKEWRGDAEKRAKIQLIINQIAKERDIKPDDSLLESETKRLIEMYKEADSERARDYVYQMLLNEEVLKTLEK